MTKKPVRMLSLILAAVLLVVCCFTGCGETLTIEEFCEMVKEDFPEAHITEDAVGKRKGEHLYFFEDEKTSEYFHSTAYNPSENLYERGGFGFLIRQLKNKENTEKILNSIMPLIIKNWSSANTIKVISLGNPNDDFTKWQGEDGNDEDGSVAVVNSDIDITSDMIIYVDMSVSDDGEMYLDVSIIPK